MKDWIMELCPEIAEWQAELIAEQARRNVEAEREACAEIAEHWRSGGFPRVGVAAEIRSRGGHETKM